MKQHICILYETAPDMKCARIKIIHAYNWKHNEELISNAIFAIHQCITESVWPLQHLACFMCMSLTHSLDLSLCVFYLPVWWVTQIVLRGLVWVRMYWLSHFFSLFPSTVCFIYLVLTNSPKTGTNTVLYVCWVDECFLFLILFNINVLTTHAFSAILKMVNVAQS